MRFRVFRMSSTAMSRAVLFTVLALLAAGIASPHITAKTKLVWYNVPGNHNSYQITIQSMMDEFNKRFPDVDLDIQYSNSSFDKMLIALAGGAPPDILTVSHRGAVGAIQDGLFAPVDLSVFGAQSLADLEKQFIPGTLRTMVHNGQLYYIPSEVRIPVKPTTDSGRNRPPIPVFVRPLSERSDACDPSVAKVVGYVPLSPPRWVLKSGEWVMVGPEDSRHPGGVTSPGRTGHLLSADATFRMDSPLSVTL